MLRLGAHQAFRIKTARWVRLTQSGVRHGLLLQVEQET
jgi:hypothetical protein